MDHAERGRTTELCGGGGGVSVSLCYLPSAAGSEHSERSNGGVRQVQVQRGQLRQA
jgi:hypothetical protein